jgi:hypothetical protein
VSGEKKFERENRVEKSGSRSYEREYGRLERSVVLPSRSTLIRSQRREGKAA